MTIEAIYIKKLKPQLNTRDEYRGREVTTQTPIAVILAKIVNAELDLFHLCHPQYVMRPPVTEHVPSQSKSLCKNIARASRGCK